MPPQARDEAERWFARLRAPDCSDVERAAFERWRQDPEHRRAWAETEGIWQRLNGGGAGAADARLRALAKRAWAETTPLRSEAVPSQEGDWRRALAALPARPRASARRRGKRPRLPLALAMVLVLFAVLFGLRYVGVGTPATIYAADDTKRTVELPDGSRLQLDVGTRLAVRYSGLRRAVELENGRAVFDVAHDARRPFTVDLDQSRVTVLGTRFQVRREQDRVSVTLDSGSLRLDQRADVGRRSERLQPGQQLSYSVAEPDVWHKREVDAEAVTAWTRGRLVFRFTPLAEAVEEVNRYARPRLRLADPSLGGLQVSGNFIAGDSALAASAWTATLPLRAEPRGDEIVLSRIR